MQFIDDQAANVTLDYFERWTASPARGRLSLPVEVAASIGGAFYRSLIKACGPERLAACSEPVRSRAARVSAGLVAAYESYLDARTKLPVFDGVAIAELADLARTRDRNVGGQW
jgi:hypothetical protein